MSVLLLLASLLLVTACDRFEHGHPQASDEALQHAEEAFQEQDEHAHEPAGHDACG